MVSSKRFSQGSYTLEFSTPRHSVGLFLYPTGLNGTLLLPHGTQEDSPSTPQDSTRLFLYPTGLVGTSVRRSWQVQSGSHCKVAASSKAVQRVGSSLAGLLSPLRKALLLPPSQACIRIWLPLASPQALTALLRTQNQAHTCHLWVCSAHQNHARAPLAPLPMHRNVLLQMRLYRAAQNPRRVYMTRRG